MASKKYLELLDFTDEDLLNELKETSTQFEKMQFDHAIKGLDNPLSIREVRRDLARLNTEIRRRELEKVDPAKRQKIRARRRNK